MKSAPLLSQQRGFLDKLRADIIRPAAKNKKRRGGPKCPPGRYEHPNVGADPSVRPCRHEHPNVGADHVSARPPRTKKRRGRCPHRPINIVSVYIFQTAGTSRAASPTGRFRKRHSKGRADNIRPYISAYVLQMAGTSRTPSPTICFGRCCQIIRDVEDAVPYNLFRKKISKPPGGRGRPPLQYLETYSRFTLALL